DWQLVYLLPSYVRLVAEGADHYGSSAIERIYFVVGHYAGFLPVDGDRNDLSNRRLVLVVLRIYCYSDAGGEKLGARRRDLDAVIRVSEPHVVQRSLAFLVHYFCFCYRRLVAGTPVYGLLAAVEVPCCVKLEEGELIELVVRRVDRLVFNCPVGGFSRQIHRLF